MLLVLRKSGFEMFVIDGAHFFRLIDIILMGSVYVCVAQKWIVG